MRRVLQIVAVLGAAAALVASLSYVLRFEILRWQLGLPGWTHSAGDVHEFAVAMRDGVRLSTTVYEPTGTAPWPTILIRNPYDAPFIAAWCGIFVRSGYACVYQEVRGQMGSEGEWIPAVNELDDGEDTLAWLVEQTFHDGNIGLYGPSYLASVQWAAATRGLPPEVKTLVPLVFATDMYSLAYQRGMFRHEILTAWAAIMPGRGFANANRKHYPDLVRHRPHAEVDEVYLGVRLDWYRDYITSPGRGDPFWQQSDVAELLAAPGRTTVPVLLVGGWYDIFLAAQLGDWQKLGNRADSKFVIGPWTHLMSTAGDLELPDGRGGGWQWELVLDWMGHHLRGEPLDQPTGGVESYALGEDRWHVRPEWPPPGREHRLHLTALAGSPRCEGGSLGTNPPEQFQEVSYSYDPDDPVPMRGGAGSLAFILADGGPVHSVLQRGLCERPDVLSFTSEPLVEPLRIAGPIQVGLSVSSSAPDTAFTAKLIEVLPDGRAYNIRDSITSLAYRNSDSAAELYTPETVVSVEIDLWPIEWVVAAGSRLRLDISSSNFPAFHAHPNVAGIWALQEEAQTARQTLYAGPDRPAWLSLHVAPLDPSEPVALR